MKVTFHLTKWILSLLGRQRRKVKGQLCIIIIYIDQNVKIRMVRSYTFVHLMKLNHPKNLL